jgi:sec-independent protein translocase protein TatA
MNILNLLLFFNIGGPEIFVIIFIILLFFGAKKLPELARGFGKGIREFKDATKEVQDQIEDGIKDDEKKKKA